MTPNMLDPWFVTGFTDGEGCFCVKIVNEIDKRKNNQEFFYYRWTPILSIGLRGDDIEILHRIKDYFGGGLISFGHRKTNQFHNHGFAVFQELSVIRHAEVIIPHFDSFPLQTRRANDFKLWKEAVLIFYSTRWRNRIWPQELNKKQKDRLIEIHTLLRERLSGGRAKKGCTNPGLPGTAYALNNAQ